MGQTIILVPESDAQELALEVARWEDDGGCAVDISYKIISNNTTQAEARIYRVALNDERLRNSASEVQAVVRTHH